MWMGRGAQREKKWQDTGLWRFILTEYSNSDSWGHLGAPSSNILLFNIHLGVFLVFWKRAADSLWTCLVFRWRQRERGESKANNFIFSMWFNSDINFFQFPCINGNLVMRVLVLEEVSGNNLSVSIHMPPQEGREFFRSAILPQIIHTVASFHICLLPTSSVSVCYLPFFLWFIIL